MKNFFTKNKEVTQIAYGIILITLIVLSIAANSFFIIREYQKGFNQSLYHQAFVVGKSIYALIKDDLDDIEKLQKNIEGVISRNSEITNISILEPVKDKFRVVVSSDPDDIGKETAFYLYQFAWQQNDNGGVTTNSFSPHLATTDDDKRTIEELINKKRWFVALPMLDNEGNKKAIISITISSDMEAAITQRNNVNTMFRTLATIFIVILFLSFTLKLWDYVLRYRKMKELDQMKDEFISMASHELRTPVTGIRGYVSMILDGTITEAEKIKEGLEMVKGATERLAVLVEDLLNVSRIEQGRMKIEASPTNIIPIISNIVKELDVQAKEKNIKLEYKNIPDNLPFVNIDPDRMRQILINIIGNAIKYTKQGSVEITTEIKEKNILELRIKDTGVGMSAKDREKLFSKFYRIQNKETAGITGTGLGLWITKKLVELMKGEIYVESIEGVGTQFILKFPVS